MTTPSFNDWTEKFTTANQAFSESMARVNNVAMETQSRLATHHLAMFEKFLTAGNKQMALVKETRNPADLLSESNKIATEFGEELAGMFRETMEIQIEATGSIASAIQAEFAKGVDAAKAEA
ncbi:MAG: phasin family protein [Pseudomonadota bacterium]